MGEKEGHTAMTGTCPLVSPTVIKCPQPKALDEFTIIQDLQPQYQFRDYFIATCKQGYQLVEVSAGADRGEPPGVQEGTEIV